MFFDNVGNLYVELDDKTVQVNISKDNKLEYDAVVVTKGEKVKCNQISYVDHYSHLSLEDVINKDMHDDNTETEYYDQMTIGDAVLNDISEEEKFDFFTDIQVPVYETEEDICALYETLIIDDNKVLFRSKNTHLPLYRLYIDQESKKVTLKPIGSTPIHITDAPANMFVKHEYIK